MLICFAEQKNFLRRPWPNYFFRNMSLTSQQKPTKRLLCVLGGIGLAANDVASALSQAVELFALRKPRYVRHIKIVVFEKSLVDSFRNSIIQAKGTALESIILLN